MYILSTYVTCFCNAATILTSDPYSSLKSDILVYFYLFCRDYSPAMETPKAKKVNQAIFQFGSVMILKDHLVNSRRMKVILFKMSSKIVAGEKHTPLHIKMIQFYLAC